MYRKLSVVAILTGIAIVVVPVLASASTVIVRPGNLQGWTVYTYGNGQATSTADSQAAMGSGEIELTTPSDAVDEVLLDRTVTPTAISDVQDMSYASKRIAGDAHAAPSYVLGIDMNGDGNVDENAGDIYAWYEPVYNGGSNYDQWQTHTLDASTTQFWSTDVVDAAAHKGGLNGGNLFTLDDVMNVASTSSSTPKIVELSINQGSGNGGWDTLVDGVSFNGTTYDFEPVATTSPVITLNGDAHMSVDYGAPFTDPGATARDVDGNALTVTTTGSINTTDSGDQTLTYSATDTSGNTATSTRVVTVGAAPLLGSHRSGGGSSATTIATGSTTTGGAVTGQVLGAFTDAETQAQIAVVKQQLVATISQLIQLLQSELAAVIAAGQH